MASLILGSALGTFAVALMDAAGRQVADAGPWRSSLVGRLGAYSLWMLGFVALPVAALIYCLGS